MKAAISTYPNKDLMEHTIEIPIKDIKSDTFTQIGSSMLEVLKKKGGIGLSANQVGLTLKMCVIDMGDGNPIIMLNPRIIKQSDKTVKNTEGCLSLPGVYATVIRHSIITVEYENVEGKTIKLEAKSNLSYCIQHELDHLNGLTLLNRLSEFHKQKAKKQLYKFRKHNK